MAEVSTLSELLEVGRDDAVAVAAPNRAPLTYQGLRAHVEQTIATLNRFGIGRNDRVAIVLPNGPEMATAFVSIAAGATTAPLNPVYRGEEFDFYLSDLGAKALVVEQGSTSPAIEVAEARQIPIIRIVSDENNPAGLFEMVSELSAFVSSGGPAETDDVALVLHTSGTTSRPKIVPLTHQNVCASARNIRTTLMLTPDDLCMNVMPLFHIHGLMAAVLSSLSVGASVFCTPGFNALQFFSWLEKANPTWYTAVPTMHQTILARAGRNQEIIAGARLRFVRSSSASLPAQVMQELEQTFDAPVVEAYAMTESAHQMTCNALPPGVRKPGTVGPAAGPEVSVMDEAGALLPVGSVGEVVIRGPNVTLGYENNPTANAEAYTNGWFRTGDQGVLDDDGYLTITGRLKEIINRGGEKISPREIDDVLMDHPAVQQVVTFAIPHDKLGEEVAAAIVLREGTEATEREIRTFASEHLAHFKVPRKVLFLDEIPKGPTGKIQRIGLAEKLGIT
ncbi:MAG: acyl--CoA ligase [bacterium]|nr:acyl--CoA ligase [bacterium]